MTAPAIQHLFSHSGALAKNLAGFEVRKEQEEMAQDVWNAFSLEKTALIEAGTGTGKSLAYLLPAILWAIEHDEQIVISTNTIALQEQLVQKDIPLAIKALGRPISFVRALGASNYLCLDRLNQEESEASLFEEKDPEITCFSDFSRKSESGTKSDLPFFPKKESWAKVSVDLHSCTNSRCAHHSACFYFAAKKKAQEAKIIVVNHHLLFADLSLRNQLNNYNQVAVLPPYRRLILDEAHHIEEIAAHHFANKVSKLELAKLLSELHTLLSSRFLHNLTHEILDAIQDTLEDRKTTLAHHLLLFDPLLDKISGQKRIIAHHRAHRFWQETVHPKAKNFIEVSKKLLKSLFDLEKAINRIKEEKVIQMLDPFRQKLLAITTKLSGQIENITHFFAEPLDSYVYWIEVHKKSEEVQLISAALDVDQILRKTLFEKIETTIFCSATLSSNKSFSYMKSRLGIISHEEKKPIEKLYASPFSYEKQVLFGVPTDISTPDSGDFQNDSIEAIKACIEASRGNAFILFTSYDALMQAHNALVSYCAEKRFVLFKQGQDHRHTLIRKFKETNRSVLLATDSFWEGVDIAGDALRLVVITKLPFHVPTEPLSQARTEKLQKDGKNPFFDYSLPKAAIKLKQAFGRLIRHKNDYGACIVLDSRLLTKGYGKVLRGSLPDCSEAFCPMKELKQKMQQFYRKKR